jgi:DNA-binding winged helix-turn-helix (wHTH) protein
VSVNETASGTQTSGHQPIVFGRFRLDFQNERLTRDGQAVHLRPKAFAMLAHLAASAGRLVTKDQLLESLWPDVFVGDSALKTCMREIRDALGDDARQPAFIETAHRRGYRFIARVDAVAPGQPTEPSSAPPAPRDPRGEITGYQIVVDAVVDTVTPTAWVARPASRTRFPIAAIPHTACTVGAW